jgi:hypothetical protein
MHLLIAHAGASSPACAGTLGQLDLPHLAALLARLAPGARDEGDEYALSPPHERALARELGWQVEDGRLPWGAREAAAAGIDTGAEPWGRVTPTHWLLARDHVSLVDPAALDLGDDESRALFDAVRALFESDGWRLLYGAPLAWYASHESLRGLPCASLDRAVGRNVDAWLSGGPSAVAADGRSNDPRLRAVRRMQNEAQMLLYHHPVNEAREARGALPVNSFWLGGCGARQAERPLPGLQLIDTLRGPALAEDWAAWADAWRALDGGPLRAALHDRAAAGALALTLCGERHAQRFEAVEQPLWTRLARRFERRPAAAAVLEAL